MDEVIPNKDTEDGNVVHITDFLAKTSMDPNGLLPFNELHPVLQGEVIDLAWLVGRLGHYLDRLNVYHDMMESCIIRLEAEVTGEGPMIIIADMRRALKEIEVEDEHLRSLTAQFDLSTQAGRTRLLRALTLQGVNTFTTPFTPVMHQVRCICFAQNNDHDHAEDTH